MSPPPATFSYADALRGHQSEAKKKSKPLDTRPADLPENVANEFPKPSSASQKPAGPPSQPPSTKKQNPKTKQKPTPKSPQKQHNQKQKTTVKPEQIQPALPLQPQESRAKPAPLSYADKLRGGKPKKPSQQSNYQQAQLTKEDWPSVTEEWPTAVEVSSVWSDSGPGTPRQGQSCSTDLRSDFSETESLIPIPGPPIRAIPRTKPASETADTNKPSKNGGAATTAGRRKSMDLRRDSRDGKATIDLPVEPTKRARGLTTGSFPVPVPRSDFHATINKAIARGERRRKEKMEEREKRIKEMIQCHDQGQFSLWETQYEWDVLIKCGKIQAKVHYDILCRESSWFRHHLPPKENMTGEYISLDCSHHQPDQLFNALRFMYYREYPRSLPVFNNARDCGESIRRDVFMYICGASVNCVSMMDFAADALDIIRKNLAGLMFASYQAEAGNVPLASHSQKFLQGLTGLLRPLHLGMAMIMEELYNEASPATLLSLRLAMARLVNALMIYPIMGGGFRQALVQEFGTALFQFCFIEHRAFVKEGMLVPDNMIPSKDMVRLKTGNVIDIPHPATTTMGVSTDTSTDTIIAGSSKYHDRDHHGLDEGQVEEQRGRSQQKLPVAEAVDIPASGPAPQPDEEKATTDTVRIHKSQPADTTSATVTATNFSPKKKLEID